MFYKKALSFGLSALIAAAVFMPMGQVSAAEGRSYTKEEIETLLLDKGVTYQSYLDKFGKSEYASDSIDIALSDYSSASADSGIEFTDSFEGRNNVLKWESGKGSIGYDINVPQSGLYNICFSYYPLEGSGNKIELGVQIDDGFPYSELTSFSLNRTFNSAKGIAKDQAGNDYNTEQIEIFGWRDMYAQSDSGVSDDPFLIYLEQGTHRIILYSHNEPFVLSSVKLAAPQKYIGYDEYLKKHGAVENGDWGKLYEAEATALKSEKNMVASSDRTSTKNSPYSYTKNVLNVIGGSTWKYPGQWLEWEIDVPKDGYYELSFRYKQSYKSGLNSHRRLLIDGSVPFSEAEILNFGYSSGWENYTVSDNGGEPVFFFLTKGKHTLRLEAVVGQLGASVSRLTDLVAKLNEEYRKCLMITGSDPDIYRDYNLDAEIPDLIDTFKAICDSLQNEYVNIKNILNSDKDIGDIINVLLYQLRDMINSPSTIPYRLDSFSSNIGSLSSWVLELKEQPLMLDYIYVSQSQAKKPAVNDSFFGAVLRECRSFIYSFIADYSNIGGESAYEKSINVWVNSGRDQANVLNAMINDMFIPETNIGVSLKITSASVIQAYLSGNAPDVSIMLGRGQPVNLALRGALYDLTEFSDFSKAKAEFQNTALVPYTLNGAVYALPDSQKFYMMFCRKDILRELGIEIPKTWDDFWKATRIIQTNNMDVGLPYTSVDASGAVDSGMGSRNIFSALLLQMGGKFYNDDLSQTALGTGEALEAFETWTNIYTKKSCPLTYNFYNRFRSGSMPLALAVYTDYNQIAAAAPEISGLWEMVSIPGTVQEDGSISIAQGGAGTAAVILASTNSPNEAWTFLKWWTGTEAQSRFSSDIEAVLGVAGRYATANVKAMRSLSWTNDEYERLMYSWSQVEEIPEAPGGYYLTRDLDNAFRDVVYNSRNARESLLSWKLSVDSEISRKREEFGLD